MVDDLCYDYGDRQVDLLWAAEANVALSSLEPVKPGRWSSFSALVNKGQLPTDRCYETKSDFSYHYQFYYSEIETNAGSIVYFTGPTPCLASLSTRQL